MKKTELMGILNITDDSFFPESRYSTVEVAIKRGLEMASQGADIIDIGGESSRPKNVYTNSADKFVTTDEEIAKVIPVIQELKKQISIPLSIDTMKYPVAVKAVEAGINWINDVTGFNNPQMRELAASSGCTLCVMHMQGTPETMQLNPSYKGSIIDNIKYWFSDILEKLMQAGVKKEQIVLDPGIGFGKTVAHNLEIIHNLPELKSLGFPVLLGTSRKQFMARLLNKTSSELLSATLAINSAAILADVDFIRVHDVIEHRDIIDIMHAYKTNSLKG